VPEVNADLPDDVLLIDDELWEELLALTDGAAAECFQCGVCTATCPWGLVRKKPLSVRTLMRQAQLGLRAGDNSLWLCTTCAQCQAYCPRGVDIAEVFRGLRTIAWKHQQVQAGLPSLLWSLHWNDNPWTQPPSQRAQWAQDLDLPIFNSQMHDILLYVGCTSSYDRRGQRIATALVQLLDAAQVKYGFLGDEEPCCGEAALSVGHRPFFEEIAGQTARIFDEHRVSKLVTISPHCYDVFKNHYPPTGIGFQPLHYTQFIAQLINEGRLKFEKALDIKVTFQDPCYLGRINGQFDAPRQVLKAIPGVELREMIGHREDGLCCGGGGGRMWLETPVGERFSDLRVEQALQTGADDLVTSCPFCVSCLEDSLKISNAESLEVLDLAEIAAQALIN
jgi:Fe-S oxidoreductase